MAAKQLRMVSLFGLLTALWLGKALWAEPFEAAGSSGTGDFYLTSNMTSPRTWHTATLLEDNRVLIAGGSPANNTTQTATAEIYDPVTGKYTPTGSMNMPRHSHSAVRLANGKVLIVGGWVSSFTQPTETAEIYDPATGQFQLTGSMSIKRGDEPPIVPGCDGKWLVLGGTFEGIFGTATSKIDRFDADAGTFTEISNLALSRRDHAVTKLPSGELLVLGGIYSCCNENENALRRRSAEVLSACGTGASPIGSALGHQRFRLPQARLTEAGNVLIVGGSPGALPLERYSPGSGTFQPSSVTDLFDARSRATVLATGDILVTGLAPGVPYGAAIYDPESDTVKKVGPGLVLSAGHAAVGLADGRVLVTGGRHPTLGTTAAGMIFDPVYAPGPFLSRVPIESVTGGLRGARVSSVLDHHVPRTGVLPDWRFPYTCTSTAACNTHLARCEGPNSELQVLAFDGQLGDAVNGANDPPSGYRTCQPPCPITFPNFNYVGSGQDNTYLNYDGHPGYDFAYGDTEWIVAAADGWLDRPLEDYVNNPCSGNATAQNQLRIQHGNGLETWYLHSAVGSECSIFPQLCLPGGGPVFLTAGQRIARVSNTGAATAHLHFEVRRVADQQIVDPFGCTDTARAQDPAACLPGGPLWREIFHDGFESGNFASWSAVVGGQ